MKLIVVLRKPMGKLFITFKNQTTEYLINTRVADHVIDKTVNDILKHYPQDATIDFIELW